MGAAQDITQLKELIEDKGRFDTLAANAPVGIFYSGPDGIAQYVNKALASIAGYPVEAMVDVLWHSKIYPEDRDAITERWLENVDSGKPWLAEFRFQKPDGTVAWVLGHTNPQFDEEGKVVSHVGTIIDITTRKLAEIELNKAHYELENAKPITISLQPGRAIWKRASPELRIKPTSASKTSARKVSRIMSNTNDTPPSSGITAGIC